MALQGKLVVVTGATGVVGEGIARAFLDEGATLICPVRSEGKEAALRAALGSPDKARLDTPVGDYSSAEGSKQLSRYLQLKYDKGVDHAVSCTGGSVPGGTVTAVTAAGFSQAMHDRVLGHVVLAQALVPLLKEDPASSYTVITGRLGEICTMPQLSLLCMANGAVYGMVVALQAEFTAKPQRINELRIGAVIRRDSEAENPHFPGARARPASLIGAEALKIATGSQRNEVAPATHNMPLQRLPDARFEFGIGDGLENLMADIYAYLEFLPDTVEPAAKAALAPVIEQHVRELYARPPASAAEISPSRLTRLAESEGLVVQVVVLKHF